MIATGTSRSAHPCCLSCGSPGLRHERGQRHVCPNCGGPHIVSRTGLVWPAAKWKAPKKPVIRPKSPAIIHNILAVGNGCRIDAERGLDVTTLACQIALSVVSGLPVLDTFATVKSPALVISTDSEADDLEYSATKVASAMMIDRHDISETFKCLSLRGAEIADFDRIAPAGCRLMIVVTPSTSRSPSAVLTIRGVGEAPREISRLTMVRNSLPGGVTLRQVPFTHGYLNTLYLIEGFPLWTLDDEANQ